MKPLRTLSLVLAIALAGLTASSCMDDSDDSYSGVYYSIGKLYLYSGYYYLKTADGVYIYPTTSSMSSLTSSSSSSTVSNMVGHVVLFCYYAELTSGTTTALEDVTAYAIVDMQDETVVVEYEGAADDVDEDAPIISIYEDDAYPYFFDETTIILPINYYIDATVHENTLVYYCDETEGSTITLHLRHSVGDDTDVSTSAYTTYYWATYSVAYYYAYFRAFDLSDVFSDAGTPSTILIKYEQSSSVDLEKATEKTYTLTYPY